MPIPQPRLLVVDDEPDFCELFAASLRREGFEVYTASDGEGALQVSRNVEPDLVLLDLRLPDIDGFTVTRRLRERRRYVPVVFLSGSDSAQDKIMGLTVGGDDFITKPFSLEELVARVRAVLRRTRPERESA